MKRKVYLDGELGERYGKELTIRANSFTDVIRCLQANYPDFRQYLIDCHEKDIGFLCEASDTPLSSEVELLLQYPEGSMYISPQPMGAKSGGAKLLAAAALIAISFAIPGGPFAVYAAGAEITFASVASAVAFTIGVNLALTGIMQIMAPDPATDSQQDESYLFQGSGQTIIEGDPVPVLYGKLRVPGRPISIVVQNQRQKFTNTSKATIGSPEPVDDSNVDAGVNPAPYYDNTQDLPEEISPAQGYTAVGGGGAVGGGTIKIDLNKAQE